MKKTFFRFITLIVLNVFLLSAVGVTCAAVKENVSPRWTYLMGTANLFEKYATYTDYDIIACGGTTSTAPTINACVEVELQYLENGTWKRFAFWEDYGRTGAAVEEYVRVWPGYTYRLLLTHMAYDTNGNLLETFSDEPGYYIASAPRN